jgi:hypothetical protein
VPITKLNSRINENEQETPPYDKYARTSILVTPEKKIHNFTKGKKLQLI